jgi:alpha-beta hydrolase superfamily lysophospholipase
MREKTYEKLDQPEVLSLLFHPRKEVGVGPCAGVIDHEFPVAKDVHIGARFHAASPEAPNILFFHGNGEIVSDYDEIGPMFNEFGMNFLVVDYRGYGRSGGKPTATAMMQDSRLIFRQVQAWLLERNHTGPFFVMGRSLGSCCAIEVAAAFQDDIAGLIIESGFACTLPLLRLMGLDAEAFGIEEGDGFMNYAKMASIVKPTFILHARYDQLIPVADAEILQAQSGAHSKEFRVVPGADHNTVMAVAGKYYFEAIGQFVNKTMGNAPRRRRKSAER